MPRVMYHIWRGVASAWRRGMVGEEQCRSLPRVSPSAEVLMALADKNWRAERNKKNPQLWHVVWAAVYRPFLLGVFALTLRGCSNALVLPLLLKAIIDAVVDGDVDLTFRNLGFLLLERLLGATLEYCGMRIMIGNVPCGVVLTLSSLVARKAATPGVQGAAAAGVDPTALAGRELTMLYARIGASSGRGFVALPSLPAGAVALIVLLGWSAIVGVAWVLFTVFLGFVLQGWAKQAEGKMSARASERLGVLSNVIGAIKAIKYSSWESQFEETLMEVRRRECCALQSRTRFSSLATTLGKMTPVTGSVVTFVVFALLGHTLHASDIFAANSVFMTMRFAVGSSGMMLEMYKSLQLVLGRTQKLLCLPELPPRSVLAQAGSSSKENVLACSQDLSVRYFGVPGGCDSSPTAFELRAHGNLALARSGHLTAICGSVGAGKSTLLQALLGAAEGEAKLSGLASTALSVGLCPQKAFLISGTIRENVLLGRPLDEGRLKRCLADACWGRDLRTMQHGLDEIIGERGVTLSGGQQARLCLARALYAEPALLLLDDPLAAVDASVGRSLLHAIRSRCDQPRSCGGQPSGVLMVLNQLYLLPNFHQVVLVNNGIVEDCGTFEGFTQHTAATKLLSGVRPKTLPLDSSEAIARSEEEAACIEHALVHFSKNSDQAGEKLIKQEVAGTGLVKWVVLRSYLLAPGLPFLVSVVIIFVLTYATLGLRDWWLGVWADSGEGASPFYMGIFVLWCASHVLLSVLCVFMISAFAARAGRNLYSDCIEKLLHAPMSYFDATPSGRITSRFGPDMAQMDTMMPVQVDFTMTFGFTFLMMSIVVVVEVPLMALVFAAAVIFSVPVVQGFTIFQQDVKRHSNNAMAPILSNLAEAQRGAVLSTAMGCHDLFMARHVTCSNWWSRLIDIGFLAPAVAESWCHACHLVVITATGLLTTARADELAKDPGLVAMYFSYAALWGNFAFATMGVVMGLLSNLTSLERLLEYKLGSLPQEPAWELDGDPAPGTWPKAGDISFQDVCLRYRPELPQALKHLSLDIQAGERLGVIGRTGAGKSSITSVLFRLVDCESGRILLNGKDISQLGLHRLRRAISMIPQEPIVMGGTVKYNLDPFGKHPPKKLEAALRACGLGSGVSLESKAGDAAGAGLSAGEKQLLTFGRMLLQDTTVVVMDEPTASVDLQTDRLVQAAAREAFVGKTVLIIAHRLETVLGCDRLAVIEAGGLAELGLPHVLAKNPESHLTHLLRAARDGDNSTQPQVSMARKAAPAMRTMLRSCLEGVRHIQPKQP